MSLNITVKPGEPITVNHRGAKLVIVINKMSKSSARVSCTGSKQFKVYRQEIQEQIDHEDAEKSKHFPHNLKQAATKVLQKLFP